MNTYPEDNEYYEENPEAPERAPKRRPSWGVDADGECRDDHPGFKVGE